MTLRRHSRRSKNEDDEGTRTSRGSGKSDRGGRAGKKRGGSKFKYNKRSDEHIKEHARQRGGDRDGFVAPNVKLYSVRDGSNSIRIMPPTWDEAEHFGYEIWVNYQIGADNNQYLSLSKMFGEDDPVEEERLAVLDEGDSDYANKLKAKRRYGVWLIDRKDEEEGPQFWAMPWTVDRDICSVASDEDTNEVLDIDDPEDGYDVKFSKEGVKEKTKYVGIKISRSSSPLSDDDRQQEDWLDEVMENPVPDILVKHDYDHIAKSFSGEKTSDKNEDRDRSRGRKEEPEEDEELDWESVHDMSARKLEALIEDEDLDVDPDEYPDDEVLADVVCEELGIEEEEEEEEKPKRRGRATKRSATKRGRGRGKDEDEDEEEEEEDRSRTRRMRRR